MLTGLNKRQASQALTLLGRAAVEYEFARSLLKSALLRFPKIVESIEASPEAMIAIANSIPYPTSNLELVEANAAVTRKIVAAFGPGTAERASWLMTESRLAATLGRREAALAAAEEAVIIYRSFAQARPDIFRRDLGESLNRLAAALVALGRREEALTAVGEAVTIYRSLAAARPDVGSGRGPSPTSSLSDLAGALTAHGRRYEIKTAHIGAEGNRES
jgi:tetratricopeptide (TPR) repeat protein